MIRFRWDFRIWILKMEIRILFGFYLIFNMLFFYNQVEVLIKIKRDFLVFQLYVFFYFFLKERRVGVVERRRKFSFIVSFSYIRSYMQFYVRSFVEFQEYYGIFFLQYCCFFLVGEEIDLEQLCDLIFFDSYVQGRNKGVMVCVWVVEQFILLWVILVE